MKNICRLGVFETNSSSTHTLTIVSAEEFEMWKEGKLFFNKDEEYLGTLEEFKKEYEEDGNKYYDSWEEYEEELIETFEEWEEDECLETFIEEYNTKGGEKIIVFGKYGNDNC